MKIFSHRNRSARRGSRIVSLGHYLLGFVILLFGSFSRAADAPSQGDFFEGGADAGKNWVEFSTGALFTSGNKAQAEQMNQYRSGFFGGIEDLHLQKDVAKDTTLSVDGRSIFDEHNYKLSLRLEKADKWYLRANVENFRTWYNGNGGFFPAAGLDFSGPGDAYAVDRRKISFEAGKTFKEGDSLSFKYTHTERDGQKSSTEWGPVHPLVTPGVRNISPSFYYLDEKSDAVELNGTYRIKKTDLGAGIRYETGSINDTRNMTFYPGEPVQQNVADRSDSTYDAFSVHTTSETWFKDNLLFSSGFMYSHMDSDLSGSRSYEEPFGGPQTGLGYTDLNGYMRENDYVLNLNLLTTPFHNFTVVPSIRVSREDWNGSTGGNGTLLGFDQPFTADGTRAVTDVSQGLDMRYTGFTNWVLYASSLVTHGDGGMSQSNGLSQVNGFGISPLAPTSIDDKRFFQKYSIGARWYPLRRLSVDFGVNYKRNEYDYNFDQDGTPNGPGPGKYYSAWIVIQDFETWDPHLRLTLRPMDNVTLVSTYEYQMSTVHTTPDPASQLTGVESSDMTSHMISQSVSWIPWSRLSFQTTFNYALSDTRTPSNGAQISGINTQAFLDARNNYWTVNCSSLFVVDDKTDLNTGYFYYQSDNYRNYALDGLPYGAGAQEQGVTAGITRQLTKNVRLKLNYAFLHYDDQTSGHHNNFESHFIFTSLQYRF